MFFNALITKILLGVTLIAISGGGYLYVKNLHLRIDQAIDNQKKLESIVEAKSLIIDSMKADFIEIKKINDLLSIKFGEAQNDVDELKKRLNPKELSKTALEKPKELQAIINKGTKFALRCNEIATGSKIKPEDDNNNICPDLIKNKKAEKQ